MEKEEVVIDRHHRWDASEYPLRSFCGITSNLKAVVDYSGTHSCLDCDEIAGFITPWRKLMKWIRRKFGSDLN